MMRNRLNEAIQKVYAKRREARRYTAMLLVLAMLTSISVSWRLHYVGTALTTDDETFCNLEEHVHTDACYEDVLVCGYEEGELIYPDEEPAAEEPEPEEPQYVKHIHTDDCYQDVEVEEEVEEQELTCGLEEHHHSDLCPIDPDTGEYLCGYEEHTHDDSCYSTVTKTVTKTERELVCGYEEGQEVLVDPVDEPETEPEPTIEPEVHHHTEACYEKKLVCTIPEHTHTAECYADWNADVEDESKWEQYAAPAQDDWNTALLTVAQGQLGYTESEKNFTVDEALGEIIGIHHYTRYGAFYNAPYGDWDVTFVSFCQHYAGIPVSVIPQRAGLMSLRSDMADMGFAYLTEGEDAPYVAIPGDIVTYYNTDGEETIGIVEECGDDTLTVISGAVNGKVARVDVLFTDITSTIRVDDAYAEYVGEEPDSDAEPDDTTDITGSDFTTLEGGDGSAVPTGNEVALDDNWINTVTVTVNNKDVTGDLILNDGDEVILKYEYTIPAGTLGDDCNTVIYQLPDGITLKKEANGRIEKPNTTPAEYIGTYTISTDGKVTLHFNPDKITKGADLPGDFYLRAYVDASKAGEDGTIKIPLKDHEITVNKKYDLGITKAGADPIQKNGKTYVRYTVEVSSENGYNQDITITDILNDRNDNDLYPGTYVQDSFELKKTDANGVVSDVSATPTFKDVNGSSGKTCKSFEIKDLTKLEAGEKYTLTYDVEVGNLPNGTDGAGKLVNYAKANDKKSPEIWKQFGKKIEKSAGVYDEVNNQMKWTVTVNNPYGFDLDGTKIEDTIQTSGAKLVGDVTIQQDVNGWDQWTSYAGTVTKKTDDNGFTFTFPSGSTSKKYKFEYTTTVPDGATVVDNKVTEKPKDGGGEYESGSSGTVTKRDWGVSKKHQGNAIDPEGKTNWSLETVIPAAWTEYTITDTISDLTSKDGSTTYVGSHYAYASELQEAIESNLSFEKGSGGSLTYADVTAADSKIGLEIKYYDASGNEVLSTDSTTPVTKFTIQIKNNGYTGAQLTKMTLSSYDTHVDVSKVPADADVTIKNSVNGVDSSVDYHKPNDKYTLTKSVYDSDSYSKEVTEIDYNGNPNAGTNIYYQLFLGIEHFSDDEITITDTLPEGLTFDRATAYWYGNQYNTCQPWWGNKKIDDNLTTTISEDGRTVTFKFTQLQALQQWMDAQSNAQFEGIKIRYKVHVDDTAWDKADTLRKDYKNYAEWGTRHDDADVTVRRDDEEVIQKTGKHVDGTANAEYSIVVNPNGADLLEGHPGNITLTDVLEVETRNYTATLDESSIRVYKYPKDKNSIPLGVDDYEYTVKKSSSSGRDVTTLEFTLQNKTGYVIEYTYKTDAGMSQVKLKNTATLTGGWSSDINTNLTERDSGASGGNSVLTVYKVDQQNYGVHLKGARFKLYTYQNGTWDAGTEVETGADGMFQYSLGSVMSGGVELKADTLYKLVEEEAPAGYTKSSEEYYFIWLAKGETNTSDAYKNAVGNNSPIGENVVTYFRYGASGTINVPNKRDGLVIEKKWKNKDDSEMTNPPLDKIEVQLWKYPKDQTKDQGVYDRTLELTKDDNWKITLRETDLDAQYYYYVKEITNLGEDYTVSYGTTNEGKITGTITIVNKSTNDSPSYELPSTGSTGTTPFTAAGALMMGAGLMYGYILKRRRGRRAE